MATLLLFVGALAADGPVPASPVPLAPAAMVRRLPLAQRSEIAAALGEEMLHCAIRVGRVDDFFADRKGMLAVFLDGSTAAAARLIASRATSEDASSRGGLAGLALIAAISRRRVHARRV